MLTAPTRSNAPRHAHDPAAARMTTVPIRPTSPMGTVRLPLAAPAWTQWHDVVVPVADGTTTPVDAVVLGPTGVHVVLRRPAGVADHAAAVSAAAAVIAVLPGRYRGVVTAALVDESVGDGVVVDGVVVATTPGLVDSVRLRPRVLSRSETGVVAATLSRVLTPQVVPAPRGGLWNRLIRRSRTSRPRAA